MDNVIGSKYHRLTVIKEVDQIVLPSGQTNRAYLCRCDCGKEKVIRKLHLVRGRTQSCGCVKKGRMSVSAIDKSLLRLWRSIKHRCGETYSERQHYFDRGISVCAEWKLDYEVFKSWCLRNGYDSRLQIDRMNNDLGYSPDNCRFVTPKVNVNNRRNTMWVEYKGEKIAFEMLMSRLKFDGARSASIRTRIKRGWQHDHAIDTPTRIGNYKKKIFNS